MADQEWRGGPDGKGLYGAGLGVDEKAGREHVPQVPQGNQVGLLSRRPAVKRNGEDDGVLSNSLTS